MPTKTIHLPSCYNYIGIFLTLACNLSCSYCINHTTGLKKTRTILTAKEWASFINMLSIPDDLPVTLQGGEPTLHPEFYTLIKLINPKINLDLLTNLQFDPQIFINKVSPIRFSRNAPYASIRVSYHPETMSLKTLIEKGTFLARKGYNIGFYLVDHPKYHRDIPEIKQEFKKYNLDFRLKEYLGKYQGMTYGTYQYPNAIFSKHQKCKCKTSELLISPEGNIYNCHHHLYNNVNILNNISNHELVIQDKFIPCTYYGSCNPCDVKLKNNRFQIFNHCSVTIKDIKPMEHI